MRNRVIYTYAKILKLLHGNRQGFQFKFNLSLIFSLIFNERNIWDKALDGY